MKKFPLIIMLLCSVVLFSCQKDKPVSDTEGTETTAVEETETTRSATDPSAAPINTNSLFEGAENISSVPHYICPNGCKGAGADQTGACPQCGAEYTHNDAFHANNNNIKKKRLRRVLNKSKR